MHESPLDPELIRIADEMGRRGEPKAALGRVIGLDSKQLNRLFKGERRLQLHELRKAVDWLGIPDPTATPGGSIAAMPGLVPLYGWVGATPDGHLTIADQNLRGYVPMHPAQANIRNAFALEVANVSMLPRYEPGEIIYLAPNRWPLPGRDCVLVTTGQEGLLKRLVRRTQSGVILLQLNPEREFEVAADDIAQVHAVVGRG